MDYPRETTNSATPDDRSGNSKMLCRQIRAQLITVTTGFWGLLISGSVNTFGQVPPAPSPTSVIEMRDSDRFNASGTISSHDISAERFLGSQSCSASSCHGNPRRESVLGSASHFFFDNDRHQRAGAVLREKRSNEIARRLNLPKPAWETTECLVCHAPGALNPENRQDFSVKLTEGVGCESCHGPARNWLTHHHTVEWKFPEIWSGERKLESGFRDTKTLLTRVNDCADCHVGNANQSVNHDLIAAGHPRLVFEYAAYQSLMPAHWRRSEDRQRQAMARGSQLSQSNSAARDWLLGQLVNAEHELSILSASASHPNEHPGYPNKVWPELAQYDCFACHHDLKAASWQQSRSGFNLELKPGELHWGNWSLGLLPELKTSLNQIGDNRLFEDLSCLQQRMRSPAVESKSVSNEIFDMRQRLRLAATYLDKADLRSEDLVAIRTSLLNDSTRFTNQGWDRSTQLYLALVAIDIGLSENPWESNHSNYSRKVFYEQLRTNHSFREPTRTTLQPDRKESPIRFQDKLQAIRQDFNNLKIIHSPELK